MYGYVVRLVLPPIRTIYLIVSFSEITLGILEPRGRGSTFTAPHHPYFSRTIPAETASGSGVWPRHTVAQNRNHCEGSARIWYRFRVSELPGGLLVLVIASSLLKAHLYHRYTVFFVRIAESSNQQ